MMFRLISCSGLFVAVGGVLVTPASADLLIPTANVRVESPVGEFRPLQNGESIFGPKQSFCWEGIPQAVEDASLLFWYIDPGGNWPSVSYGKTTFEVLSSGPVWMITTTRFGGGGSSSGDWLPEVTTRAQLEGQGWQEIFSGLDDTGPDHEYLIFERQMTAGERFTYRTEKYVPPMIVRAVPEPSAMMLLVGAAAVLVGCRWRRRRT